MLLLMADAGTFVNMDRLACNCSSQPQHSCLQHAWRKANAIAWDSELPRLSSTFLHAFSFTCPSVPLQTLCLGGAFCTRLKMCAKAANQIKFQTADCQMAQVAGQCLLLAIGFGAIIVADSRPLGRPLPDEAGCAFLLDFARS